MSKVSVIGAGTMGAGIAQVAAAGGWTVALLDVDAQVVESAIVAVRARFDRLVEKGRLAAGERDAAVQRLQGGIGPEAFLDCGLIVEAVVERLDVKARVLADAVRAAPPSAILATNTSSLSIGQIGAAVGAAPRTVGMHFFNPAPLMPLVEVVAGADTAPECADRVTAVAREWGKTPVRVRDTPGFIVNRVARGYYLEPLRMFEEGVAGVDEIDRALKALGGFRMGPFELMDLIGVDVNYAVSQSVWRQLGEPARLRPSDTQRRLVEAGRLGRKSGRGCYAYDRDPPAPALTFERRSFDLPEDLYRAVRRFSERATREAGSSTEQLIFARTLAAILNEAALGLDERIASPADIDTAMKLGVNYPHGPSAWAERIGRPTVRHLLDTLNRHAKDQRFTAADWLAR